MATPETHFGETPVICETLRILHEAGRLPVTRVADLLNIATSTAYDLFNRDLRYGQFRTLFRQSRDSEVQAQLLANLLGGTSWVATHLATDLDVNGDGDVDINDVLSAGIDGMAEFSRYLQDLRTALATGHPDDRTVAEIEQRHTEVMTQLAAIGQIAHHIREQQSRRRKAHAPRMVGGGA